MADITRAYEWSMLHKYQTLNNNGEHVGRVTSENVGQVTGEHIYQENKHLFDISRNFVKYNGSRGRNLKDF